ncbi:MAG: hypothetical protein ACHQNE_01795 [Candidatus Kapaibacterium sp.]
MKQEKTNESADQTNSGNESDEGKSEEYKNFERGMKAILSIPPDEAREIARRTPFPKKRGK